MGTDLYRSIIDWNAKQSEESLALAREVWDAVPWVVDVFTGPVMGGRYGDMLRWARDRFGKQYWWPAPDGGSWHAGGATVHGWTWFGFDTKEKMDEFVAAWPEPRDEIAA